MGFSVSLKDKDTYYKMTYFPEMKQILQAVLGLG